MLKPAISLLMILLSCALSAQEDSFYDIIENKGQWPASVLYATDVEHGKVFLENAGFTYHFFDLSPITNAHNTGIAPAAGSLRAKGHVVKQEFIGANKKAFSQGKGIQKTYYNYFIGNNESSWAGGCRAYAEIDRLAVYAGINFRYYVSDFTLKYDWIVAPNADPSLIQWKYNGADKIAIENGRLVISTSVNVLYEQAPIAYQLIDGEKKFVKCGFVLENGILSFEMGEYDHSKELIIDPALMFSTYSGSFADNFGYTATYDSEGNLYSGSSAFGQGYPTSTGAYQVTWGGGDGQGTLAGTDIAISKYDASGTFMQWSSFLGGVNDELPHSLICNESDEVIVYGTTSSLNFPVTTGAFDTVFNGGSTFAPSGVGTEYVNGSDIIVTRFNQSGTDLIASTFLGGSGNDGVNTSSVLKFNYADEFRGEIDIDDEGNVFISSSTFSSNFPIVNGFQNTLNGTLDGCLVKFDADLSGIIWSTFIGGSNDDTGNSVAFASNGEVYMCGGTRSTDFPSLPGALNANNQGGSADGWICRISADGSQLLDCTYFGSTAYDQLYFVELDGEDQVHVYGQTLASAFTFIINAGWSEPNSGMVVSKLNPDLSSITWSTVFGTGEGEPNLSPTAFTVDVCGKIYLSGWGGSTNTNSNASTDNTTGMTVTSDAFQSSTNGGDFYLLVLEADASDLVYASFFGGGISQEHVDGGTSRFDRKGVIYQSVCAGCGSNDDFPIFPANAVSPTNNSFNCNNGVFKFDFQLPLTVADFQVPPVACVNQAVQMENTSLFSATYSWNFGDGGTSNLYEPLHAFLEEGEFEITLVVTHPGTCNGVDTLVRTITIIAPGVSSLEDAFSCNDDPVTIGITNPNAGDTYLWTPSQFISDINDPNPVFTPGVSTDYILLVQHGACVDTVYQSVEVLNVSVDASDDLLLCEEGTNTFIATVSPANSEILWSLNPDFSSPLNTDLTQSSIDIDINSPTIVYVQANVNGCTATDEINVDLVSFQTVIEGDFTACENDTVTLSLLDPNPTFEYTWSPANLIISGQGSSIVEVIVPSTTTFIVNSQTPDGCESEDSAVITVSDLNSSAVAATASPDIVVEGQSSQLLASPAGYTYSWSPASSLNSSTIINPVATPEVTTTYQVTISDGECVAAQNVTVRVVDFVCDNPSIYIPNAFTPNKDNRNDWLFVRGNNITELYFVIYDRWGEVVFETNSQSEGWNGYFKGEPVDPAVFVYYLEATCEGGQTFFDKGNITVIE
jgi:gliding motility-associated-like protein